MVEQDDFDDAVIARGFSPAAIYASHAPIIQGLPRRASTARNDALMLRKISGLTIKRKRDSG